MRMGTLCSLSDGATVVVTVWQAAAVNPFGYEVNECYSVNILIIESL